MTYARQKISNHIYYLYSIAPKDASILIIYVDNIQHVTTSDIKLSVQESTILSGLLNSGYYPLYVSAHSL